MKVIEVLLVLQEEEEGVQVQTGHERYDIYRNVEHT